MTPKHPFKETPRGHTISRQASRCALILLSVILSLPIVAAGETPRSAAPSPGLSVKDGRFFLHGKPYRGVGANYFDLFLRILRNPSDRSSLEGLGTLAKAGVPFVRFGGPYFTKEWQKYLSDKEGYFAAMDQVVKTAENNGIGLIPSLFWRPELPELVGEHGDAWGDPKSRTMALMRAYTTDMVTRYRDSPAIWAWEMGNEWSLKADLPNAAQLRKPGNDGRDDLTSRAVGITLGEFRATVRALDPLRPVFTGNSHPRDSAWHNSHEKNWKRDSLDQWKEVLLRDNIACTDTLYLHLYADKDPREQCAAWTSGFPDYLRHLREIADAKKIPIFIGEFGVGERPDLPREQVRERFTGLLAAIEQGGVDLAAVWVYDLPSQNKDWNITFTNPRAYMLEEVIAANRRMSGR